MAADRSCPQLRMHDAPMHDHPCLPPLQLLLLLAPLSIKPPAFVRSFLRFSMVAAGDYFPVKIVSKGGHGSGGRRRAWPAAQLSGRGPAWLLARMAVTCCTPGTLAGVGGRGG